jgi:hypothetical protein
LPRLALMAAKTLCVDSYLMMDMNFLKCYPTERINAHDQCVFPKTQEDLQSSRWTTMGRVGSRTTAETGQEHIYQEERLRKYRAQLRARASKKKP